MNILLSGAGGVYVKELIKRLDRKLFDQIVIVDTDFKSLKKIEADYKYQVPLGNKKNFLPKILKIINKHNIRVLVSVVDEELQNILSIKKSDLFLLQPNSFFTKICLDKFKLCTELYKKKINAFNTYELKDYRGEFGYPIILKPKVGRGSRGVHAIKNETEYKKILKKINNKKNIIVQKKTIGDEYTVSVVVNHKNNDYSIIPKKIILKKSYTRKAITKKNKFVIKKCEEIIKSFKPSGPFNVQCIAKNNKVEIFEINPRLSTSSTLTSAAGVNEINILVKKKLNRNFSIKNLKWRENIELNRAQTDSFKYPLKNKKNIKYKIISKKYEIENFKKFFLSYYKKKRGYSEKLLDYQFNNNPFGKSIIYCSILNNRIIGCLVLMPVYFYLNKKKIKCFRPQNVLIERNYRNYGIFNNLVLKSNKIIDKNAGISFPNDKSFKAFKNNGWNYKYEVNLYEKNIIKKNIQTKYKYKKINSFSSIHENLWKLQIRNEYDIFPSKAYLNWRYFKKPNVKFECFEYYCQDSLRGFFILKKYLNIGHICQIVGDKKYFKDNLKFIENYFANNKVNKISMWSDKKNNKTLRYSKFNRKELEENFILKGLKNSNINRFNIGMHYSDVY